MITSNDAANRKTIAQSKGLECSGGGLVFKDVNFALTEDAYFTANGVEYPTTIRFDGAIGISGSTRYYVFVCSGNAVIYTATATFSGSVTGKRYNCIEGGCIIAKGKADQLPGTEAGTKDASSTVC